MAARVLVVEDDSTVAEVIIDYLSKSGFLVSLAADGPTALDSYTAFEPDLVILDRMLPRMDGLRVCQALRRHSNVPVIMLTALGDAEDRIEGLETGADDYITKPFSPRELVLRVHSVLRRTTQETPSQRIGDLRLDPARQRVFKAGTPVSLTQREFNLLLFLFAHTGEVVSREELLRQVWQWDVGDSSTVTVYVRRLREKIEDDPADPALLVTVWGAGYRLGPPVNGTAG